MNDIVTVGSRDDEHKRVVLTRGEEKSPRNKTSPRHTSPRNRLIAGDVTMYARLVLDEQWELVVDLLKKQDAISQLVASLPSPPHHLMGASRAAGVAAAHGLVVHAPPHTLSPTGDEVDVKRKELVTGTFFILE